MSRETESSSQQSIFEHLAELRHRIINSLYGFVVATFVCFHYCGPIFEYIRKPIEPYLPNGGLVYTAPIDKFMAYVKIAIVCGIVTSSPLWLYQIWKFISPGLYKNEKKYATGFIFSGTTLFLLGISFSYFVVLPMAFKFLMNFGSTADKPMITIDHYLSFVTQISLMFGISFELPLILTTLGMMGIVSQAFLKDKRRYAIMGMAIFSAIVTPPDLLSMVLMLVPLVLLYELSILTVGIFERKRADDLSAQNERE